MRRTTAGPDFRSPPLAPWLAAGALCLLYAAPLLAQAGQAAFPPPPATSSAPLWYQDVYSALIRLPIAAFLGAVLALRPKRRGTPRRTPAVVQTQIILAVVGAVIMLVVGASLARAFGIVGAANLIRYRSKISDPKDAGVMLCCLAVGLAAGVGLYGLAGVSTVFLVAVLAVIESFEPTRVGLFDLEITVGKNAAETRPLIETTLQRFHIEHAVRSTSDQELTYDVTVPYEVDTDQVTNALLRVGPEGSVAVTWNERSPKKS